MLDDRRLFLVPPADTEADGELSVLGVRQSQALGDALGDVALRAVYAGPGLAEGDTATAIAQRHGLVVRRKPALGFRPSEPFTSAAARVIEAFETIARVGPGRISLVVAPFEAVRIILAHCSGLAPSPEDPLELAPASITEITVEEACSVVERLGDISHLSQLNRDTLLND